MLASEAAAHGATYVDTCTATIGHDACQPTGQGGLRARSRPPRPPWHPNALGEKAMAAQVEAGQVEAAIG